MDLTIEIPFHFHNSSPKYDNWNPPPAPKVGVMKNHNHFFDWNNSKVLKSTLEEKDCYEEVEEFIYYIDHKDKKSYKSHFEDKIRILIKKELINDNIKRLYILTKDYDVWFRSHIDLLRSEDDSKYYDMQWI